jgi:putative holin Dp-1
MTQPEEETNPVSTLMSNRTYDWLKFVTTILLPATGAFYAGMAAIWNWPNAIGFNGTINLVVTMLGVTLGLSTKAYKRKVSPQGQTYDGAIQVLPPKPGQPTPFMLQVPNGVEDIASKDAVVLRVDKK